MVDIIQKPDLDPASFTNDNSLTAGGIAVRVDATSVVGLALAANVQVVSGIVPPVAAPPKTPALHIDTATQVLYSYDGAAWTPINTGGASVAEISSGAGVPVAAPAATPAIYINTTDNQTYWWNGTAWAATATGGGLGISQDAGAATPTVLLDFPAADFAVTPIAGGLAVRRKKLVPLGAPIFITASGTYTPSANAAAINVEVVGGGGGSAGVNANAAGEAIASSGGASGSYCSTFIEDPVAATVVIGAGGAAGAINVASFAAGGNGGTSSFTDGTFTLTAPGGEGGAALADNANFNMNSPYGLSDGGAPLAAPTGGRVNIPSNPGEPGRMSGTAAGGPSVFVHRGRGGSSPYGTASLNSQTGGSVTGANISGNASSPTGYGAGASGASSYNSGGNALGAAGGNGVVVIQEYERV